MNYWEAQGIKMAVLLKAVGAETHRGDYLRRFNAHENFLKRAGRHADNRNCIGFGACK